MSPFSFSRCISFTLTFFLSPYILALTLFAFFPTRGFLRFRRYYLVLGRGDSPPGGDDGNRTHDPLLAGQVLSQLSYTPIWGFFFEFPFGHSKLNNKLYAHSSLVYFFSPSVFFGLLYFRISDIPDLFDPYITFSIERR